MRAVRFRGLHRMPEMALAAAAIVAILGSTGIGRGLAAAAAPWLPVDPSGVDGLDLVTAATTLIALAIGLRRRKRLALPLAITTFAAALITQGLLLRHPLAAALALGCLVVMVLDWHRYRARTGPRMRTLVLGIMALGVGVLVAGSILVDLAAAAPRGSALDQLASWVVETLDFIDPTGLLTPRNSGSILEALEFVTGTAVLVAAVAVLASDPDRPSADLLDRDRSIARGLATGPLAPFQVGPDALVFSGGEERGVVAYGRAGRIAVVLGDPIGRSSDAWRAFQAFEERCGMGDVEVAVYQATAGAAVELARRGYRVFRVGEEAVIDLAGWDLRGPRRANLRHTVARAERSGLRVTWYPDGLPPAQIETWAGELERIDRAWQATHGRAMQFTMSRFEPSVLSGVGVAVAVDVRGSVQAFATFRRTSGDQWVLDLLRRTSSMIPGAMESCIAVAATEMRTAGALELSLGLVALSGLSRTVGPPEERLLAVAKLVSGPVYSVDRLRFFKAKFDPAWQPRYGAIRGRAMFVPFALTLLRLHLDLGAARPDAGRSRSDSRVIGRIRRWLRAAPAG